MGNAMMKTYLVLVDPEVEAQLELGDDVVVLDRGVYLVRTTQTQSQLYHAVKRRLHPAKLLVAPLSSLPKFKGMRSGATKLARALVLEAPR